MAPERLTALDASLLYLEQPAIDGSLDELCKAAGV